MASSVLRTYSKPRKCIICGNDIPSTKRSYCSKECRKEALRRMAKNERKRARELGLNYEIYISRRDGKDEID